MAGGTLLGGDTQGAELELLGESMETLLDLLYGPFQPLPALGAGFRTKTSGGQGQGVGVNERMGHIACT